MHLDVSRGTHLMADLVPVSGVEEAMLEALREALDI
jgi:hypothetical protein